MNLITLFEMQDVLDKKIVKEKELKERDLIDEKFVALHTELGEMMNEQRSWKFWSEDKEPRIEEWVECSACNGTGDLNYEIVQEEAEGSGGHEYVDCEECDCAGTIGTRNPLLEEYVDVLHFLLSIGNEIGAHNQDYSVPCVCEKTIELQYLSLVREVAKMHHLLKFGMEQPFDTYRIVFMQFVNLGGMIGFTWEQVEESYYKKNHINHERQKNGY